jgi:hypothetical protein
MVNYKRHIDNIALNDTFCKTSELRKKIRCILSLYFFRIFLLVEPLLKDQEIQILRIGKGELKNHLFNNNSFIYHKKYKKFYEHAT